MRSMLLLSSVLAAAILPAKSGAALVIQFTDGSSLSSPPAATWDPGDGETAAPGTLTVFDTNPTSPATVDTPNGMRFTNRIIQYSPAGTELGNKVTITFQMRRPFQVVKGGTNSRAHGQYVGQVVWNGDFDGVMMQYRAYYEDDTMTEIPKSERGVATNSADLAGNGVTNFNLTLKTPSGPAGQGGATLNQGANASLVADAVLMFTPQTIGTTLQFRFPASFDVFVAAVPEPSSSVLFTTLAAMFLPPFLRSRRVTFANSAMAAPARSHV